MDVITADSVSLAWFNAIKLLEAGSRELWDLVIEIRDPRAPHDMVIEAALSQELARRGLPSVDTVASTIFPEAVWTTSHGNRQRLYYRYLRMVPKLRRFPGNSRGTYFERLVRWPPGRGSYNQLEEV